MVLIILARFAAPWHLIGPRRPSAARDVMHRRPWRGYR